MDPMVRPRWEMPWAAVVDDSCVPREPAQPIEKPGRLSLSLSFTYSLPLYPSIDSLFCGLANKNKTQNARR